MKKIISLVLVLALALCLSVPTFAESVVDNKGDATLNQNVTGTATFAAADAVYYVEVTWGTMAFEYSEKAGAWNTTSLTHGASVPTPWNVAGTGTATYDTVVVTNKSNADVTAELTGAIADTDDVPTIGSTAFAYCDTAEGAYATTIGVATLTTADNGTGGGAGTATSKTFYVSLSGTPLGAITAGTTLGTLTVTIAAAA